MRASVFQINLALTLLLKRFNSAIHWTVKEIGQNLFELSYLPMSLNAGRPLQSYKLLVAKKYKCINIL